MFFVYVTLRYEITIRLECSYVKQLSTTNKFSESHKDKNGVLN